MKPSPRGPVTIVVDGKLVHGWWKAGTIRSRNGKRMIAANVELAAEGTRWCRRFVTEADDDGKALLAAAAMSNDDQQRHVQKLVKEFWKLYPDQEFAREAQRRR